MSKPLPDNFTVGTRWNYKSGEIHAGFDYGCRIGTPLFAVRGGKILRVVDHIENLGVNENGKKGDDPNYIMLGITYKSEPVTVLYLHVSPNVPVKVGDRVVDGQKIGESGHNGHSEGPHLHISVMRRHNHTDPFDYLDKLLNNTNPPKSGLAPNGITIYPPSLVYSPSPWARGKVRMVRLAPGNTDSNSVRRLQYRLNGISLVGGAELNLTGNYNQATRAEVQKWQVQKRNATPGQPGGDGILTRPQARRLFPSPRYTLVV